MLCAPDEFFETGDGSDLATPMQEDIAIWLQLDKILQYGVLADS
jgi:hypothetical protein